MSLPQTIIWFVISVAALCCGGMEIGGAVKTIDKTHQPLVRREVRNQPDKHDDSLHLPGHSLSSSVSPHGQTVSRSLVESSIASVDANNEQDEQKMEKQEEQEMRKEGGDEKESDELYEQEDMKKEGGDEEEDDELYENIAEQEDDGNSFGENRLGDDDIDAIGYESAFNSSGRELLSTRSKDWDCWNSCSKKGGLCGSCGVDMACCRINRRRGDGYYCNYGSVGCNWYHCCKPIPGSLADPIRRRR